MQGAVSRIREAAPFVMLCLFDGQPQLDVARVAAGSAAGIPVDDRLLGSVGQLIAAARQPLRNRLSAQPMLKNIAIKTSFLFTSGFCRGILYIHP